MIYMCTSVRILTVWCVAVILVKKIDVHVKLYDVPGVEPRECTCSTANVFAFTVVCVCLSRECDEPVAVDI